MSEDMGQKKYGNYVKASLWPYYPEIPVFQLLRDTAKRLPDKPAILYPRRLTFRELDLLSDRLASALDNLDICKNRKVALFLWNSPEFFISFLGILKTGATVTALNPSFKEKEAKYQIKDSESTTIILDEAQYPILKGIRDELTGLENVIIIGEKRYTETYLLKDLLEINVNPPKVEIDPKKDIAVLQYTAGTTGLPKGCILTHFNIVTNVLQILFPSLGKACEDDIFLSHLPFYHIYGMTVQLLSGIRLGASQLIQKRFEPKEFLGLIEKYRATIVYTVMPVINTLVNYPNLSKYDLSSLRFINNGAVPIMLPIAKRFEELTGVTLTQGYGLSEASPVTNFNPLTQIKLQSIGPPLPDTEEKIVDLKTGTKELPPGEVGELIIKGPQVMKGYWKRPLKTAKALRDGWLYTGDIAKMDEDGYVYIIDRKKEIIKYMGFTIGPAELESVLLEHQAVADCAVVGKPDSIAVEIPKGFVLLKEGVKATEEELIRFVEERVAGYKKIREIEFVDTIPRNLAGKVLRRVFIEKERAARVI